MLQCDILRVNGPSGLSGWIRNLDLSKLAHICYINIDEIVTKLADRITPHSVCIENPKRVKGYDLKLPFCSTNKCSQENFFLPETSMVVIPLRPRFVPCCCEASLRSWTGITISAAGCAGGTVLMAGAELVDVVLVEPPI